MVMAQKTKEAEITEQDSLLLTRNLLRIAIYNISYIRGLFPEKYFNDKSVPALEMKIKKLMPMDDESRRLIDWMEKGVYDALQKKYLKTLLFCICEKEEGPMIEEYAFSFSYPNPKGEEVSMNLSRTGSKKNSATFKSNEAEVTPDQMRSSACKMIRTLVSLMRTLDQMPDERTILMKLLYYDDVTPEDYEPPFFKGCADNDALNIWNKNPLKMEVGSVNSKHLVLALKVKSILDPCEANNVNSEDDTTSLGHESDQDDDLSDTEVRPSEVDRYVVAPNDGTCEGQSGSVSEEDTQDPAHEEEIIAQVREWIHSRDISTVKASDVFSNFPDISMEMVEDILERLLKDGLLSRASKDSYDVTKIADPRTPHVKKEVTVQNVSPTEGTKSNNVDTMYMKALYHTLPMDYVTIAKLQGKLDGEANQNTVRKLIDKMVQDGYIKDSGNRRLGKAVIHSEATNKKLLEIKRILEVDLGEEMDADTKSGATEFERKYHPMTEADMLENIEIGEQKQINEAYKAAQKKGTDKDKFNDDPLSKKPMLSHYDDPMEGVTLDEGGRCTGEAEKELRKRIEGGSVQKKTDRSSSSSSSPMDRFSHKKDYKSSWIEAVKQKNHLERIVRELQQERERIVRELQQEREEKSCLAECQEIFGNALVELPIIFNECRLLEEKIAEYENQKRLLEDLKLRLTEAEQKIVEAEQKIVEGENLRKKLHNIILELKGNIRVFCRVRPMFSNESGAVSYPKSGENIGRGVELMHKTQAYSFAFDKVFDHAASQEEVFTEISQLVQSAIDGYKVCIFAYGQTGSGKTHTMMGDPEVDDQKGLIPRSIEQIFQTSQCPISQGWKYTIKASMLEIYNETIRDLLATNCTSLQNVAASKCNITDDANGSDYTIVDVSRIDEVSSLIKQAAKNRSVAKTAMNEKSSRSHFVFTLRILGVNEGTDQQVQGFLNLIDLAGSERADKSDAIGDRLKELQAINTSLLHLRNVIFAIANKDFHIPYRDSKLTLLLEPCLGADSKTLMFLNLSPEASSTGESICSLCFAKSVKEGNLCELRNRPPQRKHRRSLSQG